MVNIETFKEIYHSIRRNRMRTALSGFGVSWGMLILVVLLGTGKGFQDGVMDMFGVFARKSLYIYGGSTSEKHRNISEGKQVQFDQAYLDNLRGRYHEIAGISPEASATLPVRQGIKSGFFRITGVHSDYMQIKILKVNGDGRLFNLPDVRDSRPVAIIGANVESALFGRRQATGGMIDIAGTLFRVVGVLRNDDMFSASEINTIYVPFTAYRKAISSDSQFAAFCLYLLPEANSQAFEEDMRNYIAHRSEFSAKDRQALYIANFETQTSSFESLFNGLRKIIWIFGFCFLASGIVGITNIMFVVVKDRTGEIGIRLATGATPGSIVRLILIEAIVVTTLSGMAGMIAGKGLLALIDRLLDTSQENMFMKQTSFDPASTVAALTVLVIAGAFAGAFPAVRASAIEPVDAIRYENRG